MRSGPWLPLRPHLLALSPWVTLSQPHQPLGFSPRHTRLSYASGPLHIHALCLGMSSPWCPHGLFPYFIQTLAQREYHFLRPSCTTLLKIEHFLPQVTWLFGGLKQCLISHKSVPQVGNSKLSWLFCFHVIAAGVVLVAAFIWKSVGARMWWVASVFPWDLSSWVGGPLLGRSLSEKEKAEGATS